MQSQNFLIFQHLEREGSIDSIEAIRLYGITRLAARILDLKDSGIPIVSTMISATSRTGKKTKVARYFLYKDY